MTVHAQIGSRFDKAAKLSVISSNLNGDQDIIILHQSMGSMSFTHCMSVEQAREMAEALLVAVSSVERAIRIRDEINADDAATDGQPS